MMSLKYFFKKNIPSHRRVVPWHHDPRASPGSRPPRARELSRFPRRSPWNSNSWRPSWVRLGEKKRGDLGLMG